MSASAYAATGTPLGRFNGALAGISLDDLTAAEITAVLTQAVVSARGDSPNAAERSPDSRFTPPNHLCRRLRGKGGGYGRTA